MNSEINRAEGYGQKLSLFTYRIHSTFTNIVNMNIKSILLFALFAFHFSLLSAQNPYLPLWEYIPDSEPYVFEDPDRPGKYRVYIYGSHDSLIKEYCGLEQVTWSAPVEDLTNWRPLLNLQYQQILLLQE